MKGRRSRKEGEDEAERKEGKEGKEKQKGRKGMRREAASYPHVKAELNMRIILT